VVIYGLWWKKPLNVSCPLRVYKDHATLESGPGPESESHDQTERLTEPNTQKTNETGLGARSEPVELISPTTTRIRSFPDAIVGLIGDITGTEGTGYIEEEKRVSTFTHAERITTRSDFYLLS
jgi:hypothetical protein